MKIHIPLIIASALILTSCVSKEEEPSLTTITKSASEQTNDVNTSMSPAFKHDEYLIEDAKGMILLCHQARWSRGEYLETAPIFNELGYSCIAIDQRSGDSINGVNNIISAMYGDTADYEEAIPDINFAIDRAYDKNGKEPIILLGSSYSSTLALLLGPPNDKVKAMVSFSPGDYFPNTGSVAESLKTTTKPVWMTYSKSEYDQGGSELAANGAEGMVTCFKPEGGEGHHGSRALYAKHETSEEYWASLKAFLASLED